ncbi:unnamed protein product, partial [Vitis vinifera]
MAEHRNGNAKPSDGKASGAASPYAINLDNFTKRLKTLYSHWKEHSSDLWGSSDALAIATPPASDDLRDITNGFSDLFAMKDSTELTNVKKAAFLTSSVMKHFVVPKLEKKAILEPARVKVKLKAENVDICYPPIFQSGGEFDLRPSASSNDENLYYDSTSVIICAIGSRYNSYCSNVARTFLIDANAMQSKAYEVLLKAHEAAIGALKPGNKLRRQHQAELARQKNEETARRLAGGGSGAGDNRGAVKATGDLIAYKNVNDLPPPKELMIQVDQKNEAILLPIYGSMVPFHVATVKSVSSQQDTNRTCYIRIIFNVPGTPFSPHDSNSMKFQGSIYLKEVSFRSKDPRHISEVVQMIKTLRRQVASRESERAERATLVTQEKLQLAGTRFKPIRLSDLWIRPSFGGRGRKLTGSLESHTNGFRYSTSRPDERVDIMYGNIKHAFFQPAEKEMITLLHFHLHNHIMVGNKKTKDVQFFVEVMDRDRKNKINMDFQNFVNRVNDLWGQPQFKGLDLEFDQPLRELGFHGVPHKASAFIVPTSSCLVELIETPFLVITLSEIEIVNLERVGLGQKNFDMTIVFKDFKRDTITEDPEKFIEDGGWEFLNLEVSDSDSENSQESDQGYEPSDVQSDTGSEEEGDDSESLVESEDDVEEDSDGDSEEEQGKTWEELEREASNADREKGDESDSEEERKRRKMKAFGKARVPEKRSTRGSLPKRPKLR